MKNIQSSKTIKSAVSRLHLAAGGVLVLAAAALAAIAANPNPPKLPWAAPTVTVGNLAQTVAVDLATNTIYVPNPDDNTISIIDGRRCNSTNSSRCSAIATMTNVGFFPAWITIDSSTRTLYVVNGLTENGDFGNQVAVLDGANCNALDTSGCNQPPVTLVTVAGTTQNDFGDESDMALDAPLQTLYVSDANFGPLSMINTATCNAHQTSGCDQVLTTTATGFGLAIDPSNHSVYVSNLDTLSVSVFNGATCNATTQSDCGAVSVAPLPSDKLPYFSAIDPSTHTLYLVLFAQDALSSTAIIDVSTCNGTNHSGCGQEPQFVLTRGGATQVGIDSSTQTAYTLAANSSTLTAINVATCNGTNHSGCATNMPPALACGSLPYTFAINSDTHTIYVPSSDTNRVWVLDTRKCNGMHTEGCTKFAPTAVTGVAPVDVKQNPNTHSLYVSNQAENSVSIIDTLECNQTNARDCQHAWPKFAAGHTPRFIGINKVTNTIYVANQGDNNLAVIDGATCNSTTMSGCGSFATTPVQHLAQQVAVDETTNTIYVVNQADNNMSVIDGSHCNGTDTSDCHHSWPTASVGAEPQALTLNPNNHTIYVANTSDNSVSVIDASHCNANDTSGCTPLTTFPVGAGPRAVNVLFDTNTVFVGNRDDLTVSVVDGATCNAIDTSGCPQVAPPAVLVGAFPDTGGIGDNLLGRSITVDQATHKVFVPMPADSDVVVLDGNVCLPNDLNGCKAQVMRRRMGGFSLTAALDEASKTEYVVNNAEGAISIFPEPQ